MPSAPKPGKSSTVAQLSFLMEDFPSLRRLHERASPEPPIRKLCTHHHGNSWTVYFKDPEDNMIECYVHPPWHVSQPYGKPIDFSLSDAQIRQRTESDAVANPTYKPAATFRAELEARLREEVP